MKDSVVCEIILTKRILKKYQLTAKSRQLFQSNPLPLQLFTKQLFYMVLAKEMTETLGFMIVHTGKQLLKAINETFAGISKEITFEQMGVLYFLSRNTGKKDMIQQDIAELMDKNKSAVLRSIDILEQKGFVKRLQAINDRRKNVIALTESGKIVIDKMYDFFLEQDVALTGGIDENELATCLKVLSKVQLKCRNNEHMLAMS